MRVLYFHQHFSTPYGSTGTRSYEFAKKLVQRGHEVTVVCGAHKGGDTGLTAPFISARRAGEVEGFKVIEFQLPYSNNDKILKRSVTFLKYSFQSVLVLWQESYDMVFATSTPLTAAIPGIIARWFKRKPFVFEVRDLWPELPEAMGVIRNPFFLWVLSGLEWLSYHSANHIIGLSPGIEKGIEKRGVRKNKLRMIPNGCDLELFSPSSEESPSKFELPGFSYFAVFSGAHGLANGLDQLLDVAIELKKAGRLDIGLLFVGDGFLKPELMRQAADKKLDNCVFLEPVTKIELVEILRSATVGLMVLSDIPAFYYGTSPNKFFDYISSGLPVINNYSGWLAELIKDNFCGAAVPAGDYKKFAAKIIEVCDNDGVRAAMARSARQLAESTFSRSELADEFADVLELVSQNKDPF